MTSERRNGSGRRDYDNSSVHMARIEEQLKSLGAKIDENFKSIDKRMDENFKSIGKRLDSKVSRIEFVPVRNLVYGLVGLVMVAVLGALFALVIIVPNGTATLVP